jgi:hypothetical protein
VAYSSLNMEAVRYSETQVNFQRITRMLRLRRQHSSKCIPFADHHSFSKLFKTSLFLSSTEVRSLFFFITEIPWLKFGQETDSLKRILTVSSGKHPGYVASIEIPFYSPLIINVP